MAYLALSNGRVFEGTRIGAQKDCVGELVFTTGVVGYLETLTDPCYAGQLVMQTFPLIGNYGVMEEDLEAAPAAAGYVVHDLCDTPSNFRSQYPLDAYLKANGIPGISGVDTRELTRILREEGVLMAMICDERPNLPLQAEPAAVQMNLHTQPVCVPASTEKKHSVALVDFGVKQSVIRALCSRGCDVTIVPASMGAQRILESAPDGIVLSAGPGDPAAAPEAIALVRDLMGQIPMLGMGLGHQLAALATGGHTHRMHCGHRGANQPVKDLQTGRTYITCQNHGYVVDADSVKHVGETCFVNLNDHTCEGIQYPGLRCLTVQFEPDACPSTVNTSFVYDRWIAMMGGKQDA